ncbi:hypothetical protein PACTADRAFT_47525 [Pachysolen tannophilus NRRL Y-2460]|uniref:Large ribosomal subunit protein bL34m n=1 Tax=Pachysolen tannophilus NRRL Y-2460 TaxID=669874 RepID=A0A1E4U0Y1_PACTA|nr:hypothetical protein PACTADRAFT_47525 [Pachysolen tannophilus NRRL Y-2460]
MLGSFSSNSFVSSSVLHLHPTTRPVSILLAVNNFQNQIYPRVSPILSLLQQQQQKRFIRGGGRGGNRGNTYQPSTLKRKRRLGFLARMKSLTGRKIIKRRSLKGRWYLSH